MEDSLAAVNLKSDNDCSLEKTEDLVSSLLETTEVESQTNLIGFKSYELFKDALFQYEKDTVTKYNIWSLKTKQFCKNTTLTEILLASKELPKICWECKKGANLHIPFDGVPYLYLNTCRYQCHQGKDKNVNSKKKHETMQAEKRGSDHSAWVKTRKSSQQTKKLDCPVMFNVVKVYKFPTYQISKDTSWQRSTTSKRLKEYFTKLKESLAKDDDDKFSISDRQPYEGCLEFLTVFPSGEHLNHNHDLVAGLAEPLDERISNHLKGLISSGCRNVKELLTKSNEFVRDEILCGEESPESFGRKFNPNRKKIKNLITRVKLETQFSKTEQENIEKLIEKWRKWGDVHFSARCKTSTANNFENTKEKEDKVVKVNVSYNSLNKKFIFIYQSDTMKRLYRRYAPELILLDPTYRTTKYSSPFYFLVVNTNVNYQVAAVIMAQEKSHKMIKMALQTVKEWNPDTVPKYALIDFDAAEFIALESVFPQTQVFLCDFYREQAWTRWVNKGKNGFKTFAADVLYRLRKISHAVDENEMTFAINDLKKWEKYEGNLKKWFEGTWEPEIKKWVLAYRPNDLMHCNTNNGIEGLCEDLIYGELVEYNNYALSELLTFVIEEFIPKLYEKYIEMNVQYTSGFEEYQDCIPRNWQNRPIWFVVDMLEKKNKVTEALVDSIKRVDETIFDVYSDVISEDSFYRVNFGDSENYCSCNCLSFRKERVLCKHFFAVMMSGLKSFQDITPLYRNHPFTIIDDDLFIVQYEDCPEVTLNTEVSIENIIEIPNQFSCATDHAAKARNKIVNLPTTDSRIRQNTNKMNLIANIKLLNEKCVNIRDAEDCLGELNEGVEALIQIADMQLTYQLPPSSKRKGNILSSENLATKKSKNQPYCDHAGAQICSDEKVNNICEPISKDQSKSPIEVGVSLANIQGSYIQT